MPTGRASPRQIREILFPLSSELALRGRAEGEENVVNIDAASVAEINSHMIANATRQVYADDHAFKYARGESQELRSGATLLQDDNFILAGNRPDGKIVALKPI